MAINRLSDVYNTDTDNNLGVANLVAPEKTCGLLFDISAYYDETTKKNTFFDKTENAALKSRLENTIALFTMDDFKESAIKGGVAGTLCGIPCYHIEKFFNIVGENAKLYICFKDCKSNWNGLIEMQKAANGNISNFGIWTEQELWSEPKSGSTTYTLNLVDKINETMVELARDYKSPGVCVLNANTSRIKKTSGTPDKVVKVANIPTCIVGARYVSVSLGQESSSYTHEAQAKLTTTTPVGNIGMALGIMARERVHSSIASVGNCPLGSYVSEIEFGFGDSTVETDSKAIKTPGVYESLSLSELDTLDAFKYIYLKRYMGRAGEVYFNRDYTCSDTDYRLILLNRIINKSRRLVRNALLPLVNSPMAVNPTNGQISSAAVTILKNKVTDALNTMKTAGELESFTVSIPSNQNVLQSDEVKLSYSLIPTSTPKVFDVTEGFALHQ